MWPDGAAGLWLALLALPLALGVAAAAGFRLTTRPALAIAVAFVSLPLDRVLSVGIISISDAMFALAFVAVVLDTNTRALELHHARLAQGAFLFLILWLCAGVLQRPGGAADAPVTTMIVQALILVVVPGALRSERDLDLALRALWGAGGVAVLTGVVQILYFLRTGEMLFEVDRPWLFFAPLGTIVLRMSGALENAAQFAFLLVFPTVSLGVWLAHGRQPSDGRWLRPLLWVLMLTLLMALLATFTRGAVLAVLVAVGCAIFYLSRHRALVLTLAIAGVAVGAGLLVKVVQSVASVNLASIGARETAAAETWRQFWGSPVFGYGLGSKVSVGDGVQHYPHSALLQSALDGGVVGLAAFCAGIALVLLAVARVAFALSARDAAEARTANAVLFGIAGVLVETLLLDPTLNLKALWVPLALGIAVGTVANERSRPVHVLPLARAVRS